MLGGHWIDGFRVNGGTNGPVWSETEGWEKWAENGPDNGHGREESTDTEDITGGFDMRG